MIKFHRLYFLLFIFFFFNTNNSFGNDKIAIIDLDTVFNNSDFGQALLKDIEKLNQDNISKLTSIENELKKSEQNIKNKKNVISQNEFDKELASLKNKINDYRKLKKEMVDKIEQEKKIILKKFFKEINPIIQNYMEKNSINILLERKNVFIGKNNSDITITIINEINNKIKFK